MSTSDPLVDRFGRPHRDLRISVTDRCNLRCRYCMPAEGVAARPHAEILTFEEIERLVRIAVRMGIREVRVTGGEPLVRKGVCTLVRRLAAIPGIEDLAMTTNAVLLGPYAAELKAAGLQRLNISLDSLDRDRFRQVTRRDDLPRVLEGIAAARRAGFARIKLNALAIRGQTEKDVVPLARFARQGGMELRFIEYMPLDADARWQLVQVLPGAEILDLLRQGIGPLVPVASADPQAPATEYRFADGRGTIGLIGSVTEPFCHRCGRLRLTAEGTIRNCLFASEECDVRVLLRSGASNEDLARLLVKAVQGKRRARGTDDGQFARPDRTMHQIGG